MHDGFDPLTHPGRMPSPCISLCVMDPDSELCQGCQRTMDEIIAWSSATEIGKRAIWIAIAERQRLA